MSQLISTPDHSSKSLIKSGRMIINCRHGSLERPCLWCQMWCDSADYWSFCCCIETSAICVLWALLVLIAVIFIWNFCTGHLIHAHWTHTYIHTYITRNLLDCWGRVVCSPRRRQGWQSFAQPSHRTSNHANEQSTSNLRRQHSLYCFWFQHITTIANAAYRTSILFYEGRDSPRHSHPDEDRHTAQCRWYIYEGLALPAIQLSSWTTQRPTSWSATNAKHTLTRLQINVLQHTSFFFSGYDTHSYLHHFFISFTFSYWVPQYLPSKISVTWFFSDVLLRLEQFSLSIFFLSFPFFSSNTSTHIDSH